MTPAETARNEAAKQAVAMGFAIVGILIMIPLYRKMGREFAASQIAQTDPIERSIASARAAQQAAKRWDKLSTILFRYGPSRAYWWASDRAEAARKAYDAERG